MTLREICKRLTNFGGCDSTTPQAPVYREEESSYLGVSTDKYLSMLRADGWVIAIHNDYHLNQLFHTFYLFTNKNGRWVKGEGLTDREALHEAFEESRKIKTQLRSVCDQDLTKTVELVKLRKLLAMAINQMNGAISFSGPCTGELLRRIAIEEKLYIFDEIHHAAACPANHYHKSRLPTGKCSCGAEKGDVF